MYDMELWLEHQMCTISTAHCPGKVPLLQHCSAMQPEVPWLSNAFSGNWWEIMMLSEWNNLCLEGHSSERCHFNLNYKELLQILLLRQIFFPSRNKYSTYWTKSIKMHQWVCMWTRSWASLTLCSCWTQGEAQTPAGHISKDIWGPQSHTNQCSLRAEGCQGLCLGFAPLVESFKRKTRLPEVQLLLWAKLPSHETINSKFLV